MHEQELLTNGSALSADLRFQSRPQEDMIW